jgi:LysM repeat protein
MENEQQPKSTNSPSPLVPQGALPDSRGRSHIRIAVFSILAVHAVLLGTLLIFGCKKAPDQTTAADQNVPADLTNAFPAAPPPQMAFTPPQFPETTATQVQPSAPPPPVTTTAVEPPATQQPVVSMTAPNSLLPSDGAREHVVLKGESYYTIARKYNTTMKAIAQANPGVDANRLKIGQKLTVPPPQAAPAQLMADAGAPGAMGERIHTVKAGDNLTTIARRHGVSIKDIQSVNNLRTTQIRVGQKLRLPEKSNAPALDAIPPLTPTSSTAGSTVVPVLPQ